MMSFWDKSAMIRFRALNSTDAGAVRGNASAYVKPYADT